MHTKIMEIELVVGDLLLLFGGMRLTSSNHTLINFDENPVP